MINLIIGVCDKTFLYLFSFFTYTTEYFCCHFLIKLAKNNSNIISLQGKKEEISVIDIFIHITQMLLYIAKKTQQPPNIFNRQISVLHVS